MIRNTANDLRWEEFRKYTEANAMSKYERRLLRDWVRSGHSVYEMVESRYLPGPSYPPMDFLDAYRSDRELREAIKGMTRAEKDQFLKKCMGWEDPTPEDIAMENARKNTPELIRERVVCLERELFSLWKFVTREGLEEEAMEYVEERKNEAIPFEW